MIDWLNFRNLFDVVVVHMFSNGRNMWENGLTKSDYANPLSPIHTNWWHEDNNFSGFPQLYKYRKNYKKIFPDGYSRELLGTIDNIT